MKRTTILFSAACAAAIATLAGCTPGNSSYEQTRPCPAKVTEVGPGGTYITEITYKPNSFETNREVRSLNGLPVYEKTNFKGTPYDQSYVQINYGEGGGKTYQRVATVASGNKITVSTYAITSESDTSAGTLTESIETRYRENTINYDEIIRTKGGTVVSREYDFDHTYYRTDTQYPYYTYKRSVEGGEPVSMCYYVNKATIYGDILEYTIYKNWVDTNNKGDVVESKTEYQTSGMTANYTITTTNKDTGHLESIKVSVDYIDITEKN